MDLILGGGKKDRAIRDAETRLAEYRTDDGFRYYEYSSVTPRDRLFPEDLAVTLAMNSMVRVGAFKSVQDRGSSLDLSALPDKPLEQTSADERAELSSFLAEVANWPYFGASVATKLLHKKRSALIPILDNQAIFGAYMNPAWPAEHSLADTVKSASRIREALDQIAFDLTRSENLEAWSELGALEADRTAIEVFDMIWWMYFRSKEPR